MSSSISSSADSFTLFPTASATIDASAAAAISSAYAAQTSLIAQYGINQTKPYCLYSDSNEGQPVQPGGFSACCPPSHYHVKRNVQYCYMNRTPFLNGTVNARTMEDAFQNSGILEQNMSLCIQNQNVTKANATLLLCQWPPGSKPVSVVASASASALSAISASASASASASCTDFWDGQTQCSPSPAASTSATTSASASATPTSAASAKAVGWTTMLMTFGLIGLCVL